MVAAFDTLQAAKRPNEAGVNDAQADFAALAAHIDRLRADTSSDINRLAADIERLGVDAKADIDRLAAVNKADLDALEGRIDTKHDRFAAEVRAEFALIRSEMEGLRPDVTIRLDGMIIVATGVLLAATIFT